MKLLRDLFDLAVQSDAAFSPHTQATLRQAESLLKSAEAITPTGNVLKVEIPERDWTPIDAVAYVAELRLSGPHIVLVSGRGPIWLYGMIVHAAHATRAVGLYDPRLGGYVVVESHCSEYVTGQLVDA